MIKKFYILFKLKGEQIGPITMRLTGQQSPIHLANENNGECTKNYAKGVWVKKRFAPSGESGRPNHKKINRFRAVAEEIIGWA